jgi:hypothetical protein
LQPLDVLDVFSSLDHAPSARSSAYDRGYRGAVHCRKNVLLPYDLSGLCIRNLCLYPLCLYPFTWKKACKGPFTAYDRLRNVRFLVPGRCRTGQQNRGVTYRPDVTFTLRTDIGEGKLVLTGIYR